MFEFFRLIIEITLFHRQTDLKGLNNVNKN